jgi:hypothetical protein
MLDTPKFNFKILIKYNISPVHSTSIVIFSSQILIRTQNWAKTLAISPSNLSLNWVSKHTGNTLFSFFSQIHESIEVKKPGAWMAGSLNPPKKTDGRD